MRQLATRRETLRKQAFGNARTEHFSSNGKSEIDKQAHEVGPLPYEENSSANKCEERAATAELLFAKSTSQQHARMPEILYNSSRIEEQGVVPRLVGSQLDGVNDLVSLASTFRRTGLGFGRLPGTPMSSVSPDSYRDGKNPNHGVQVNDDPANAPSAGRR
ncbi:hypothetical protein TWF481_002970 [Arthrobotrys musiformis]|uniref:Uncharacterized protein n=1 Tax=Arthrobotrys musiformis TaxID=47236 RepID=A0AAV9VXX5_9PEZI